MTSLRPVLHLIEEATLRYALRKLKPTHPVVPKIVLRLNDRNQPSPLDPADSIVTGFCILAALALGLLGLWHALPGGGR